MDPTLKSSIAVYEEMQRSLYMWGDLLTSTGGALKPEKCFWYLVDYEFKDGEWIYTDTVDWELLVPLPDGSEEPIQQYDVHHCEKTLGVWSSPSGEEGSQLEKNRGKGGKMDLPDGEWSPSGKICMGFV